jgi:predicted  nucleic acid-binding Zn-ribbon protein
MNCGRTYEDDSNEIVDGCECGSSLFMYENEIEMSEDELEEEKSQVKDDIEEMVSQGEKERGNIKLEFDLDSISVQEEGVYNINVSRLLKEMPLVIEKSEGIYRIHLPSAFDPEDKDIEIEDLG